ncbi:segregation and condensation protein B [Vagococcus vulneris]|uniref:Segregation and condensation protein B n=1 Tax=Vagococcus vulneris TaxID=1977869 RepID=A0A429ZWR5_9ENTE|nr:segregation and condensation protein B [Vagococcus vulneris]RST98260.1 segregation and condensation protein B [Vagococcus vulneris]
MIEETGLETGQFEVNGTVYELRYNLQKIKTIEMVTKKSISAEVVQNNGILPIQLMESLFSFGLVTANDLKVVPQSKATAMFEPFINENGAITVNNMIVEKLQEDAGFLFR